MSSAAWISDLLAWSLQAAVVSGLGLALPTLFGLDPPSLRLRYWQGVLAAALVLPVLGSLGRPAVGLPLFQEEILVGGAWMERLAVPDAAGPLSPPTVLLAVLVLVTAFRLLRLGLGFRTLRSWRGGAAEIALAPEIARDLASLAPHARFLVSERVTGPLTFGWRAPVVLLPPAFRELDREAQHAVLHHEILHVRRRDWLFSLLEAGIRAVLWFHPGIILLLTRIELAREQAIDRQVVRSTGARRPYLRALLAFACPPRPADAAGLPFLNRGHLRERVAQLTQEVTMSRRRAFFSTAAFACFLLATAMLANATFPLGATTAFANSATTLSASAEDEPVRIKGAIRKPNRISGDDPVYPDAANQVKAKGTVKLDIVISKSGKVEDVAIVSSSGREDLDQSAVTAIKTWTFEPATRSGKPIAVIFTATVKFES